MSRSRVKRKGRGALVIILRIVLCIFTAVDVLLFGLLGVIFVLEKGPSERARDLFVISMNETSAAKFVPTIFLTQQEVDDILAANTFQETDTVTDTELVVISSEPEKSAQEDETIDPDGDGIDIIDVSGSTFKGKLMLVYDPSRVFVGVSGKYGATEYGKTLPDIYARYDNIVGAINGGGWDDRDGHGTGGEPWGVVISQGEVLWGTPMYYTWDMAGLTYENKLVVGKMTIQDAVDMGVRDAVKYGPPLIVNGEPLESLGTGSGLNPRTAIGQRADGTMMLLTIDGRQGNSLGASLADVRDVMLEYGAVNAYNLDGGSSTNMIYNGEIINNGASLVGLRKMCNAWLVRGKE
ncbi:MAG: phosphodiester glycosidase family protein [Oscillospiraceae bacterium]